MITQKVIETIYKKYRKLPASPYDLNIGLMFAPEMDCHNITVDGDNVVLGSVSPDSPFHTVGLDRIHAILDFERHLAIVLPASILFLTKNSPSVNIHLKALKPSVFDRLRAHFAPAAED